jgi:hypothetical protein
MQIISMISHRDKAPTNALLAKREICAERGVPKLQYGSEFPGVSETSNCTTISNESMYRAITLPEPHGKTRSQFEVASRNPAIAAAAWRIPLSTSGQNSTISNIGTTRSTGQ